MREPIKANLPKEDTHNAKNLSGEKELIHSAEGVVFDSQAWSLASRDQRKQYPDCGLSVCVDARFWMSRSGDGASTVYCSVWILSRQGKHFAGYGTASGYGYDKQSGALQEALDSAGVKLSRSIHGTGEVWETVEAIMVASGYGRCPRIIL